ncbi:hypothetical protein Tco_1275814 [Tanacetum coccineum]
MENDFHSIDIPLIQENLKLNYGDQFIDDKPSEANYEKMTVDTEAESMVSVTIQQDTSVIPPMTSLVIGPVPRPDSPNVHWLLPTTTTTTSATTTTTLPLPPQPQQGPSDPIIIKRMGELEEALTTNLVEENQALKHAPIRALASSDLPNDSIRRYECEDFDVYKAQEETKKKSKQDSPKTPHGLLPSPPPPPPPPSGASGAFGTTRASDSAQDPPPPPSIAIIHHQGGQSTSTAAPSSSKTTASAEYSAWTMTNTRIKPSITTIPDDLYMDDETTADEQAYSSGEEVGRDHIPTVNLRQSWWKPLTEDRPASPEPAWTIPSSDLPVPTNNWASALKTTYVPPPENSLLAQPVISRPFMDELCSFISRSKCNKCHKLLTDKVDDAILQYNVSKPLPLGGEPDWQTSLVYLKDEGGFLSRCRLRATGTDQFWIEEELKYDITAMFGNHSLIDEALDYRVKEFRVNKTNPGMNTRFWTKKDCPKARISCSLSKSIKTRCIIPESEAFVVDGFREGDYQVTEETE